MAVKNKFLLNDSLEIMTPAGNLTFTLQTLQNGKGQPVDVAPGDGHKVWLEVPEELGLDFALLLRNLPAGATTQAPMGTEKA